MKRSLLLLLPLGMVLLVLAGPFAASAQTAAINAVFPLDGPPSEWRWSTHPGHTTPAVDLNHVDGDYRKPVYAMWDGVVTNAGPSGAGPHCAGTMSPYPIPRPKNEPTSATLTASR